MQLRTIAIVYSEGFTNIIKPAGDPEEPETLQYDPVELLNCKCFILFAHKHTH